MSIIGATSLAATISTSGAVNAPAGVATVAAAARQPSLTATANTQAAVILAAALNIPPAFQVARSTPTVTAAVTSANTVTDPRDGISMVTAGVTSTPGVTDPRDGTATVTAPDTSSPTVT